MCVASCRQMLPQLFGEQSEGKRGRQKGVVSAGRKKVNKRTSNTPERRTERRIAAVNSDISRRFPQSQLK